MKKKSTQSSAKNNTESESKKTKKLKDILNKISYPSRNNSLNQKNLEKASQILKEAEEYISKNKNVGEEFKSSYLELKEFLQD